MESFHIIVLTIATIVLIISLATIGTLMQKGSKAGPFPPISLKCPDGWVETYDSETDSYTCTTLDLSKNLTSSDGITTSTSGTTKSISYTDKATTICQKHKWAQKNDIVWDGVSNYNSC
jgi:hypothetical protein